MNDLDVVDISHSDSGPKGIPAGQEVRRLVYHSTRSFEFSLFTFDISLTK